MKKMIIGGLAAGAVALGIAAAVPAPAHADEPGVWGSLVCQQLALGATPSQIAEALHQGDPRYSFSQTLATVRDDMQDCN